MAQSAEMQKDLEDILHSLEIPSGKKLEIENIAKEILAFKPLAHSNNLPRAKLCSKEKAKSEIEEFTKKAQALRTHIHNMHWTTLKHYTTHRARDPIYIDMLLEDMVGLERFPINDDEFIKDPLVRNSNKIEALELTRFLAKIYSSITEKEITRVWDPFESKEKGNFNKFVKDVFKALNIDASANSQVRNFMEN